MLDLNMKIMIVFKRYYFYSERGQTIAIIGRTGSGKTTLMNLLMRLYDYTEGSIKIDGVELNQTIKNGFAVI